MKKEELITIAKEAAELSYAPYSHFRVGAALLCFDGKVIKGCNVENRSYGLTICAERNAVATAIGKGIHEFSALAIYCPDAAYAVSPCGACRQVISEFVQDDFPVYFQGGAGEIVCRTIKELFPDDALYELKKN